jgi:hypothetical protein
VSEPELRATLPVVSGHTHLDAVTLAALDRSFLDRQGIAPWDDSVPWSESAAWVKAHGYAGVWERHVRAHGQVYECPGWCQAVDHPRQGIIHAGDGPIHAACEVEVGAGRSAVVVLLAADDAALAPALRVYAEDGQLSTGEARQLAAALLNAADALDAIIEDDR